MYTVILKYSSSRFYASENKLTWQMGFISNSNILLILQKDLVYRTLHMMLYFCANGTYWHYTDCNTSANWRCLCHQMWYREGHKLHLRCRSWLKLVQWIEAGIVDHIKNFPTLLRDLRQRLSSGIRYQNLALTLRGTGTQDTTTEGAREDTCI